MECPVCNVGKAHKYLEIQGVEYFECMECTSIFADPQFMDKQSDSVQSNYGEDYWSFEVKSAKDRSFGSSLCRVAETFFYARKPISAFVDIGTGPGYLLDSVSMLMPNYRDCFYGVELNPPPQQFRTTHENYLVGGLEKLPRKVSAGCCIEVIEHLSPKILRNLVSELAAVSEDGAVFYFNSAQPSFVTGTDLGYLDPHVRGHIVSYSIAGLKKIFKQFGFTVIPMPGRDWCFLAEKSDLSESELTADNLMQRVWHPNESNRKMLTDNGFGPLMYTAGLEAARCYIEAAVVEQRTKWALSLQADKEAK